MHFADIINSKFFYCRQTPSSQKHYHHISVKIKKLRSNCSIVSRCKKSTPTQGTKKQHPYPWGLAHKKTAPFRVRLGYFYIFRIKLRFSVKSQKLRSNRCLFLCCIKSALKHYHHISVKNQKLRNNRMYFAFMHVPKKFPLHILYISSSKFF